VIIAGFRPVGRTVAAMLELHKGRMSGSTAIPTGWRPRAHGVPVYFGDMTQIELRRRLQSGHCARPGGDPGRPGCHPFFRSSIGPPRKSAVQVQQIESEIGKPLWLAPGMRPANRQCA
jgi:hypothetical protein